MDEIISTQELVLGALTKSDNTKLDVNASPFKLVVDPAVRERLRKGLLRLIEHHDDQMAELVQKNELSVDSYKEYIELFARAIHESMSSKDGVRYLLAECGFMVSDENINLSPEWRWKD